MAGNLFPGYTFLEDRIYMEERVLESIKKADKLLIGIGESFQENFTSLKSEMFSILEKEDALEAGYQKIEYLKALKEDVVKEAYQKLYYLIKDKDYYILSTCTDDKIFEIGFDNDKIVTPCGGFRFLQCQDNCQNELLPITSDMIAKREKIKCPHCGSDCCFNQLPQEHYNENGYLTSWQQYNKWLQNTLNRNICILELGVGLTYPTVIRWPFEKIAFYNKKAVMYRVHDSLYQSTKELKEKCVSIKNNPILFLNN